jgi:hypothetical protein
MGVVAPTTTTTLPITITYSLNGATTSVSEQGTAYFCPTIATSVDLTNPVTYSLIIGTTYSHSDLLTNNAIPIPKIEPPNCFTTSTVLLRQDETALNTTETDIFQFTSGTSYSLDITAPSTVQTHTVLYQWTVNDSNGATYESVATYQFLCAETTISSVAVDQAYTGTFDLYIDQFYSYDSLVALGVFPSLTVTPADCFTSYTTLYQDSEAVLTQD